MYMLLVVVFLEDSPAFQKRIQDLSGTWIFLSYAWTPQLCRLPILHFSLNHSLKLHAYVKQSGGNQDNN